MHIEEEIMRLSTSLIGLSLGTLGGGTQDLVTNPVHTTALMAPYASSKKIEEEFKFNENMRSTAVWLWIKMDHIKKSSYNVCAGFVQMMLHFFFKVIIKVASLLKHVCGT